MIPPGYCLLNSKGVVHQYPLYDHPNGIMISLLSLGLNTERMVLGNNNELQNVLELQLNFKQLHILKLYWGDLF